LVSQPLAHDCGEETADDPVAAVPGSCDGQVSLTFQLAPSAKLSRIVSMSPATNAR
jgi:hypothetical protein